MNRNIRYGVLSTSRTARNCHVPAARKTHNSEVVAIASRDKATAARWAKELNIPTAYGSYEELLADGEVDAVINALPNSLHCHWSVQAARAGKHVLCEKPLALTVAEAQEMADAAKAGGVLLMEAFKHRFHPQLPFVRQIIESEAIGDLRMVRAELVYTIQDWQADSRTFKDLGGGALMDAGCYCVNTIRFLMGAEPLAVQAFQRMHEAAGVDSTFVGILEFSQGRLAQLVTSMEQPFRGCCEIVGTTGRIEVPNLFGNSTVRVVCDQQERLETFEPGDLFARQLEHFSECVLEGKPPALSPKDAIANTAALAALKRAATDRRQVALA